jgi:hypothetical protein
VPDPVWIVSLVLLWAVVGLLCLVVLSLLRQVGALRLRLESEAGRPVGLALGDDPPPTPVHALDGGRFVVGGPRERPLLIVRVGGEADALMAALASLAALPAPDGADTLAVVAEPGEPPPGGTAPPVVLVRERGLPPGLVPDGPGGAVALDPGGALAARGHPASSGHLGEMVAAARQGGWSAGGVRERDWGESVPSW